MTSSCFSPASQDSALLSEEVVTKKKRGIAFRLPSEYTSRGSKVSMVDICAKLHCSHLSVVLSPLKTREKPLFRVRGRDISTCPCRSPAAAGAGAIVAPLPGTVTNVAVSAGASVKRGDLLLVMEAMKMENDIRSDRDGVVKSVYVAAGKTVMQGDPLVEIG